MKTTKRAFLVGIVLALVVVARLIYAAFSGTKRELGSESRFEDATVTSSIAIGTIAAEGSIYFKPHDTPGTCDGDNAGKLYADDSENCMKLCNGTAWTSLCQ